MLNSSKLLVPAVVTVGLLVSAAGASARNAESAPRADAVQRNADHPPAARDARRRGRTCRSRAGKNTVARSGGVYVYQQVNLTLLVCSGRGKVRVLPNQDQGTFLTLGNLVITGTWLAWANTSQPDPLDPEIDSVYVMNVRTGKVLVNGVSAWPDQEPTSCPAWVPCLTNQSVVGMVLAPNGSVAWLANISPLDGGPATAFSVVHIGANGAQSTLAQGSNLAGLSASANGVTVSWTQNGVPASAPLA
jgi:hypothetical protein